MLYMLGQLNRYPTTWDEWTGRSTAGFSRYLLFAENIDSRLGESTGAGTAGFVDIFGHGAAACIAFTQAFEDLGRAGVVMLRKECL